MNLKAHVENMRKFGVPVVVAINRFHTDTKDELQVVDDCCKELEFRMPCPKCSGREEKAEKIWPELL